MKDSKALRYIISKGWSYNESSDQAVLDTCPINGCSNHCYVNISGEEKDGLWDCKKCGERGNLHTMREYLGDKGNFQQVSMREVAAKRSAPEPLPDVQKAHDTLMALETLEAKAAFDYLIDERGFTLDVVERFKLGVGQFYSHKNDGNVTGLLIPYWHNGKVVQAKWRALPPAKKDFRGLSGRDSRIFNEDAIKVGMELLFLVEGEPDTLAMLSAGINEVCGLPGANSGKAGWLTTLDNAKITNIYLLYDRDDVGQKGAKEMAKRIGMERCYNILLPEFEVPTEDGGTKPGKDVNEWFRYGGGNKEKLLELAAQASKFHIDGVVSTGEVIENIRTRLKGGNLGPKYKTQFAGLNQILGGFREGGVYGVNAPPKTGKTTFCLNLIDYLVEEYGETGLVHCEEMPPDELVEKWVSMKTETVEEDITEETLDTALGMVANYKADLLFAYTAQRKFNLVADVIRQAVRRYNCKFVVFDNLQLLSSAKDNWTQEIANNANAFKALAMELNIVLLLVVQPHSLKQGEFATSDNVHGSSQVKAAVDAMINLNRQALTPDVDAAALSMVGTVQLTESFSPICNVYVDRTRRSPGGFYPLHFEGAISKFFDHAPESANPVQPVQPIAHNVPRDWEPPQDMVEP